MSMCLFAREKPCHAGFPEGLADKLGEQVTRLAHPSYVGVS